MKTTEAAQEAVHEGLDGVIVANTQLSKVDGALGRLVIRGYDVEALAGELPFEAVCSLLWWGKAQPEAVRDALAAARVQAFAALDTLGDALAACDGMEALRAALAHRVEGETPTATLTQLTGALAVFAGAWARIQAGERPVAPDPGRGHAEDTLRMLTGREPTPAQARALDAYLATVAEHGMNASTFAARVVASTGSDAVSAVVAALGALKGPLHGGAPGPVLDMLDAIARPEAAASWLEAELSAGRRIMGMGHRIYRVRDPRAAVLERAVETLESSGDAVGHRLPLARAVEEAAGEALRARYPQRSLEANVEFYTAVLLDAIGLDRTHFTPTFAIARVAGWLAHVTEQRERGRLIRPVARYVGPVPSAA
ncbi:MAG: citrate synthase [Proteobacteria bacterium]|nr:citrate synthase [Pseudomonadota bacterium]